MKISKEILYKALNEGINKNIMQIDDELEFGKSGLSDFAKSKIKQSSEEIWNEKIYNLLEIDEYGNIDITIEKYIQLLEWYNLYNAKLVLPSGTTGEEILRHIIILMNGQIYETQGSIRVSKKLLSKNRYKNLNKRILNDISKDEKELEQIENIDFRWIDTRNIKDLSGVFKHSNFKTINIQGWNTINVEKFYEMFKGTPNLISIYGIEDFNMSTADSVECMFYEAGSSDLSIDLSKWNTSNIRTFTYIFGNYNGKSVGNLANWKFDNIKESTYIGSGMDPCIFYGAQNLEYIGDISNWNIKNKCLLMNEFFYNCFKLSNVGDLSKWADNKFITVYLMFENCGIKCDISNWYLENVENTAYGIPYKKSFWPSQKYLMMIDCAMPMNCWPELAVKAYKDGMKLGEIKSKSERKKKKYN